jgi:hypothetical protein
LGFCTISITIALSDLRAPARELQVLVETVLNWFFVDHISGRSKAGYWRYNVMPTRPT